MVSSEYMLPIVSVWIPTRLSWESTYLYNLSRRDENRILIRKKCESFEFLLRLILTTSFYAQLVTGFMESTLLYIITKLSTVYLLASVFPIFNSALTIRNIPIPKRNHL